MSLVRTCLLSALAVLLLAAPAGAATRMVATATPEAPQFSPAGDISYIRASCAAEDAKAVRTYVRCWSVNGGETSRTVNGPAAAATARVYSPWAFTFCAEARFTYASGFVGSTGVRCAPGEFGFATVTG
jgi:hypothetical protein